MYKRQELDGTFGKSPLLHRWGLGLIGSTVKEVIYYHFENVTSIRKEQIPYNIKDFLNFLNKVFGSASLTIEDLMLREVSKEFEMEPSSLEDVIRRVLM